MYHMHAEMMITTFYYQSLFKQREKAQKLSP
jgi:hypothetical protein